MTLRFHAATHFSVDFDTEDRVAELEVDDFVTNLEIVDVHRTRLLLGDNHDQG